MGDPRSDEGRPPAAAPASTPVPTPVPAAATPAPSRARPSKEPRAWAANDGTQVAKKADSARRLVAFAIDGVIAGAVSVIPIAGNLLAGLYLLLRDGFDVAFMDGRSIGKRVMGLRPLCDDGAPMTPETSARRNWPIAVPSLAAFLGLVPVAGSTIKPVGVAAGIVLIILECYLAMSDVTGVRWGDRLAGTRVVDSES